jgi:hypothetical protein
MVVLVTGVETAAGVNGGLDAAEAFDPTRTAPELPCRSVDATPGLT